MSPASSPSTARHAAKARGQTRSNARRGRRTSLSRPNSTSVWMVRSWASSKTMTLAGGLVRGGVGLGFGGGGLGGVHAVLCQSCLHARRLRALVSLVQDDDAGGGLGVGVFQVSQTALDQPREPRAMTWGWVGCVLPRITHRVNPSSAAPQRSRAEHLGAASVGSAPRQLAWLHRDPKRKPRPQAPDPKSTRSWEALAAPKSNPRIPDPQT